MERLHYILGGILIIFLILSGYLWFELKNLEEAYRNIEGVLADEKKERAAEFASSTAHIAVLDGKLEKTESVLDETADKLEETTDERNDLEDTLVEEKGRNDEFEEKLEEISGTVGVLDKLAKTDPELLQKYSKVYFLNEHYTPEDIVEIEKEHLYIEAVPKYVHAKVEGTLVDMLEDAKDDGINIWVVSGFRSFDHQADLKGHYTTVYGEGANTFSADQGYSEHQLGTTLDFTTTGLGGGLDGFENTAAYTWLQKNAHKYGFTLSYPERNGYYIFEPWHWRYVGIDLATDLYKDREFFYDLDQREIDEYLVDLFE